MKRVVYRAVLIVISLVGITNIVDSIIASNMADASTSSLTMSATINPSSTITINSNSVTLDITPSASGTLKSSDALTVSAYTNTNYDCNVTMTANSSSLVSGANSIPTLATGTTYTDATFTNDSWGYKLGTNGEYKSVLAGEGANAIKTISSMTGSTANTTDIYFAAKLTPATKPGTYTNTVTFASTCTPPPVSDISELTYMQDFASLTSSEKSDVLGSMTTGTQYQLKDSRDQKDYYISKLADGNVWMTQNLDHNIVTTAGYYTPQNTDIPSAWTPSTATYATGTTTWDETATGDTTPQSYDPGNKYWNGNFPDWEEEDYELTLSDYRYIADTGDRHYHVGNYYNWTAAIATNDSSIYNTDGADANQSICPAGWTLPTKNTGNGKIPWSNLSQLYSFIIDNPTYNLASGRWHGSSQDLYWSGHWWSREAKSSTRAYMSLTAIDDQDIYDDDNRRYDGLPIRCVAR